MEFKIIEWVGEELLPFVDKVAELRIKVFREFPYLYEGDLAYEKKYLDVYLKSKKSLVIGVLHEDRLIGASTALPLFDESEEFKTPFVTAGYDISKIFYFGESIILPEYRGNKLGHEFFTRREAFARKTLNHLQYTCFCAVIRPDDHPLKPPKYKPLDSFWGRLGYEKSSRLNVQYKWQDIDKSAEDFKSMNVWLKRF